MPAPAPAARPDELLQFIQQQGLALRADDAPPASLEAWQTQRDKLRRNLFAAWGGRPEGLPPLESRVVGELRRDGYRVEKLLLGTLPGLWMTANAYVPDGAGPFPAVLCVHGHWKGAKQDPTVQRRCLGLVKQGFFVLCVDAFGAGERAVGKALGEYHGEMAGATLFPAGAPLSGVQLFENMRCVDYLQSRSDVIADRLGVTGASGGGNQTMYAGALEERFACVVPVCSVGTYQAYLGAACCMCEVVPSALTFTEEAGLLALVAPRALMVINATQDAFQFSVGEAAKSIAAAGRVFELHSALDKLRHTIVESPHDYNQAMREAMYGWMKLHLADEGDGSPLAEPELAVEDPEELRCFPGDSRPDDFLTLPQYAAGLGRARLEGRTEPDHAEQWESTALGWRHLLDRRLLGGVKKRRGSSAAIAVEETGLYQLTLIPEAGLQLPAVIQQRDSGKKSVIVLDLDRGVAALDDPLCQLLAEAGHSLSACDLRGTASGAVGRDLVGRAPDHNSAEWSLWIGRPLLGQWAVDVRSLLDALTQIKNMDAPADEAGGSALATVVAFGPAGLVALAAAALDPRIEAVACLGALASYVSDVPYVGQRLGVLVPDVLRQLGDIEHLAALAAPRPLLLAGPVHGGGDPLTEEELPPAFAYTRSIYKLLGEPRNVQLSAAAAPEIARDWLSALG